MATKVSGLPRPSYVPKLWPVPSSCVLYLEGQNDVQKDEIRDISGYRNHGSIYGATWVRTERGLWVLSFDGSNDYVNCGDDTTLRAGSEGTVKVWAYPRETGKADFVRKDGGGYNDDMGLGIDLHGKAPGRIVFAFNRSPENDIPFLACDFTQDEWVQLIGTWDAAGMALYKNGVLQDSNSTACEMIAAGIDFLLGGTGEYYYGYLALVHLENNAWSSTQVLASYMLERHLFGV